MRQTGSSDQSIQRRSRLHTSQPSVSLLKLMLAWVWQQSDITNQLIIVASHWLILPTGPRTDPARIFQKLLKSAPQSHLATSIRSWTFPVEKLWREFLKYACPAVFESWGAKNDPRGLEELESASWQGGPNLSITFFASYFKLIFDHKLSPQ